MNSILLHNLNILARIIFYCLWGWVFYFDGLDLSLPMQSFFNFLVLADIVTWLIYQVYLLPRMLVQFSIGTVVNLAVIVLLIRDARSLIPQSAEMQAMAIMVFLSMAAVKGFYYLLIEMGYISPKT
jgi:hypothetical protein